MPFDIVGFQEKHKDTYGNVPLADIAKEAYETDYSDKYPDYNSFVKEHGLDKVISEDTKKRTPPTFEEKIRNAVASVTPAGYEDISTGFVKGASWGYIPATETPEDAGTGHKIARGAAELAGMATGLIPVSRGVNVGLKGISAVSKVGTVAKGVAGGAITGGIWGAGRKQEEGEDRISSALKDAAMFGTFSAGGELVKGLAGKLAPETVGKLLDKLRVTPDYVPDVAEKAILGKLGYVSSGTLGAGAGASEPAKDWEERLKNILTGAATFGLAHGAGEAFGKGKDLYKEYYLDFGENFENFFDRAFDHGETFGQRSARGEDTLAQQNFS